MRKAIALVIMIVVCSIYFIAMNNVGKEKQVATDEKTLVENIEGQDIKLKNIQGAIQEVSGYPATPKDLIQINNYIMGLQYGKEATPQLIEQTVEVLRMLYSKELLNLNDSSRQIKLLETELKENEEQGIYLIGSTIESIAFPTTETAFVQVIHETTIGNPKRQYTLTKQEELWKIHGWKDLVVDEKALEE